jgi:ribosomal protein L37AE/L43A
MLVQCKRWAAKPVGVDEVRKIAGTASTENATDVVLVTLSDFTAAALDEAPRLRVQLIDGRTLLDRIERVRRSEACPVCATPMILDRSSRGWWLRCPRFPQCTGKRDLAYEPAAAVDLLLQAD